VHPLLHRGTLHLRGRHAEHLGEPAAALWVLRLLCPEPRHGGPGQHEKGALPRQLVLLLQQPGVDAQRNRLERRHDLNIKGHFKGSQTINQLLILAAVAPEIHDSASKKISVNGVLL